MELARTEKIKREVSLDEELRILHVEDEPLDTKLVLRLLSEAGLTATMDRVATLAKFEQALEQGGYTLILSDYTIPGMNALEALRLARQRCPDVPFIFLSGTMGEEAIIESLKLGASDYVLKQRIGRLVPAVRGALSKTQEHSRRRQAEEALRQSEQRYRSLFDAIDEGFCVLEMLFDKHGHPNNWRYLEVNPAFERHNGLEHATGKTIRELAPNIEPRWFEVYGKVALTGEAIRFVECSQALHRWFDLYAFRVGAPEERKVAVLFTNITERKRTEEALRAAQEALARTNAELEHKVQERTAKLQETVSELEHFSYTITHDMRAPLRAMQGFTHLMLKGDCRECARALSRDYLGRIQVSATRMDALITDALQYSQTLRGEFPVEPMDVAALLRGMLDTYPNLLQAEIRLEGDFPPVLGNEAALTQCFSNLLSNAVKFVAPGTTPRVRVRAELVTREEESINHQPSAINQYVRLWFEDNGIGIPKEYQERIWEMFQVLKKSPDGTGVGLALVRKIVGRLGGRTGVESEPGQGSRFWVELKAARQAS